jgi:hypothetical protein
MRKLYWKGKEVIVDIVNKNKTSTTYLIKVEGEENINYVASNVHSDMYLTDDFIREIIKRRLKKK